MPATRVGVRTVFTVGPARRVDRFHILVQLFSRVNVGLPGLIFHYRVVVIFRRTPHGNILYLLFNVIVISRMVRRAHLTIGPLRAVLKVRKRPVALRVQVRYITDVTRGGCSQFT